MRYRYWRRNRKQSFEKQVCCTLLWLKTIVPSYIPKEEDFQKATNEYVCVCSSWYRVDLWILMHIRTIVSPLDMSSPSSHHCMSFSLFSCLDKIWKPTNAICYVVFSLIHFITASSIISISFPVIESNMWWYGILVEIKWHRIIWLMRSSQITFLLHTQTKTSFITSPIQ